MNPETLAHLQNAEEALREAQVLFNNRLYRGALTRSYYAMFHAATAALLARGIQRRSHHALLAAFGQTFIKSGALDERLYRHLREAFERRQQTDYEAIVEVDRNATAQLIERAIDFVDACRRLTP